MKWIFVFEIDFTNCWNEKIQSNQSSYFEFIGKSMETETTTWSEFPNGGKAIVEQILASEEINKSKRYLMCNLLYLVCNNILKANVNKK